MTLSAFFTMTGTVPSTKLGSAGGDIERGVLIAAISTAAAVADATGLFERVAAIAAVSTVDIAPTLPFTPASNTNTLAWFDFSDPDTQTISGTDLTALTNKIAGGTITLDGGAGVVFDGTRRVGGGVAARFGDSSTAGFTIGSIPNVVLNYFVGARQETSVNVSLIGDADSYLPIGFVGSSDANDLRWENVNDPVGSVYYGGVSQDASFAPTNRSTSHEWTTRFLVHTFLNIPATTQDKKFGYATTGTYTLGGNATRLVIVEGTMTTDEVTAMQDYFRRADLWEDVIFSLETDGSLIYDRSKNYVRPITRLGGVAPDVKAEYPDGSIYFDGTDDYMTMSGNVVGWDIVEDEWARSFTIDADFINEVTPNDLCVIMGQIGPGAGSNNFSWMLGHAVSGELQFQTWSSPNGSGNVIFATTKFPAANERIRVRIDQDGVRLRCYIDGVMVASRAAVATGLGQGDINIGQRGASYNSDWFQGWLGGLRVIKGVALCGSDAGYVIADEEVSLVESAPVVSISATSAVAVTTTDVASETAARYWRIQQTTNQANGSNTIISCSEIDWYETPGGAILNSGGTPIRSSALEPSFEASFAYDNNNSTFWASGVEYGRAWLGYDFGSPVTVNEFLYRNRSGSAFGAEEAMTSGVVASSDDGATWTDRWHLTSPGTWPSGGEIRTFTNPYLNITRMPVGGTGWTSVGTSNVDGAAESGWASDTIRLSIPGNLSPDFDADKIRITVSSRAGGTTPITGMWASIASNQTHGTLSVPVPISFDGSTAPFTIGAGESKVSDVIPIRYLKGLGRNLQISMEFQAGADLLGGTNTPNWDAKFKSGAFGASTSGSGWSTSTYDSYVVTDVEFFQVNEGELEATAVVAASSTVAVVLEFQPTIPAGTFSEDLVGFPVKINLADAPADFWDNVATTDGQDITVTDGSDVAIPSYVQKIDTTAKTGIVYAKQDIATATDTVFKVIGNNDAGMTAPAASDPLGKNAVWSNYAAAYFFNGDLTDETGNGRTLTAVGTPAYLADGGMDTKSAAWYGHVTDAALANIDFTMFGVAMRTIDNTDNQTFMAMNDAVGSNTDRQLLGVRDSTNQWTFFSTDYSWQESGVTADLDVVVSMGFRARAAGANPDSYHYLNGVSFSPSNDSYGSDQALIVGSGRGSTSSDWRGEIYVALYRVATFGSDEWARAEDLNFRQALGLFT